MKNAAGVVGFIAIILLVVGAVITTMTFEEVPSGHRGVVVSWGKVDQEVMGEGMNTKWFWENVVEINVKQQLTEKPSAASSKDLQAIATTVAVNYNADSARSWWIYQNIGETPAEWETRKLNPIIQESVKSVTAKFTAVDLIRDREEVKDQIEEKIKGRAEKEAGLIVTSVNITNFDFSPSFNDSIEAKVRAEQDALRARNELEKTKIEQEKKIVTAEANKQEQILIAEGRSAKIKLEADAQASANKVLSESIDDKILEFKKLEKWDGQLPKVTGGGQAAIFINPNEK